MKKTIIGFLALTVLAFFVIVTVNAQTKDQKDPKDKKVKTEAATDCSKCPSASTCTMATGVVPLPGSAAGNTGVKCDPAKCKEGKCDPATCKEGKCDPATCKAASSGAECDPATCSHHAVVKK